MKIISLFTPAIAGQIAAELKLTLGSITLRSFPDKESYFKFNFSLEGETLVLIDSLDNPNEKIIPLLFAAKTAKELGARQVILLAPYLAYMRQDMRFQPGEAITSNCFAELLSNYIDKLITVDPHLHRHHSLDEIYTIPSIVVPAAPAIAQWISKHIPKPFLIGPDSESAQWVAQIANLINAPHIILEKKRSGDRDVSLVLPDVSPYKNFTPVLVDDIISTGQTFIGLIRLLQDAHMHSPICIGVHAQFNDTAYADLQQAGAAQIVTCNTILHISNQIDLTHALARVLIQ